MTRLHLAVRWAGCAAAAFALWPTLSATNTGEPQGSAATLAPRVSLPAAVPGGTLPTTAANWVMAAPGRLLSLPADHRSHPDYRIEWWYYTGHLTGGDGERFGYQLTFFRIGVTQASVSTSTWAIRDLHMAHLAITDVRGRRYASVERLNRAGPSWAGANAERYRVWNDGWEATVDANGVHRLEARAGGEGAGALSLSLALTPTRSMITHGERGYSRKGAAEGNATYYYSLTRMATEGTITFGGRSISVRGASWMDHEFGTSLLEEAQRGWDWFSMHLSDGRDVMLFQLRRNDGAVDMHSGGTLLDAEGRSESVAVAPGTLAPGRTWRSPATDARYPVDWRISVPAQGLDLTVKATVDAQEFRGDRSGVSYWEGLIDIAGTSGGRPVTGVGYLEMTGYAGRSMSELLR